MMMAVGAQNKGLKKKIAGWARKVGAEAVAAKERGEPPPLSYGLADKLVFAVETGGTEIEAPWSAVASITVSTVVNSWSNRNGL